MIAINNIFKKRGINNLRDVEKGKGMRVGRGEFGAPECEEART